MLYFCLRYLGNEQLTSPTGDAIKLFLYWKTYEEEEEEEDEEEEEAKEEEKEEEEKASLVLLRLET